MRQHEQNEEKHDAGRSDQNEGRVLHRIGELAAHQFGSRSLRSQHFQHLVERSRHFADPDQRDIHRGKQGRMVGDRSGQTFSAQQSGPQLANHRTKPSNIGIPREQFEGVVQTGARLQEQSKVPGESRHLRRAWPVEQAEITARGDDLSRLLDGFNRQQLKVFNTVRNLRRGRSRERAVHDLSILRQRPISEIGHALTVSL